MMPEFTFETFSVDNGFGYVVFRDGLAVASQPFDPELPTDDPMTESRAIAAAEAEIEFRLSLEVEG